MEIKRICKNVGHDGESFFCMRCGKAGFDTQAKAVGHQSQCQAKNASLVVPPPTTTPPPYTTTLSPPTTTPPPSRMVLPPFERQLAGLVQDMAEIKQQFQRVYNEIPHLQAVQQAGFLGISKEGWIIIGVVAFVAYTMGQRSSLRYSVNNGSSRRTYGRVGSSIQDRVTDKAINYGINKLFK